MVDWPWLGRGAAGLHLLGLALTAALAWRDPGAGQAGAIGALPVLQLGFLAATGAAAALFALGGRGEQAASPLTSDAAQPGTGVAQLLAQMSHELRTPLNAMIGFSEVMLRELHGPLGHARYQEYVTHINESGGRLLKTSEDTLAVTATMSALMSNRGSVRRQRVLAGTLVQEAWETAVAGLAGDALRLSVSNCGSCQIECERRATEQALEHLLREAVARAQAGGAVEVKGRRRGGARSIEIRVAGPGTLPDLASAAQGRHDSADPHVAGGSLRVILARLLLEMQDATLSLFEDESGLWSACVAFAPRS
jgi:signal transduction histidine kinase